MSLSQGCLLSLLNPDSPTPIRFDISRVSSSRTKLTASGETFASLGNSIGSDMMDFCKSSFDLARKGRFFFYLISI
jgi:hypothetical protein